MIVKNNIILGNRFVCHEPGRWVVFFNYYRPRQRFTEFLTDETIKSQ